MLFIIIGYRIYPIAPSRKSSSQQTLLDYSLLIRLRAISTINTNLQGTIKEPNFECSDEGNQFICAVHWVVSQESASSLILTNSANLLITKNTEEPWFQ